MIKIPLSTVTGNEFLVYIDRENTVGQLKQLLEKEYKLQAYYIKLIYQASILPDNKKIKDIELKNDSCIFIHQSNLRAIRPRKPISPPLGHHESQHSHSFIPVPENSNSNFVKQDQQLENNNDNENHNQLNSQNLSSLIENLSDLGFNQKLCENALRLSNNDVNAAATLLLSGDPSIFEPQKHNYHQMQQNSQNQRQRQLIEDERDQLIAKYNKLTLEQQTSVERLQKLGFNMETVMQVYFACGKDEQTAKNCLISMK